MLESKCKTLHYYDYYLIMYYSFRKYHTKREGKNSSGYKWREWHEAWMCESQAEYLRFDRPVINHHGYDMSFCTITVVNSLKLYWSIKYQLHCRCSWVL